MLISSHNFTPWRVWSSKNLVPSWVGEWKVSVLNDLGDIISEDVFKYSAE